ncbi:hypothetical protein [Clostridium formicaceticum]|uniref:NTP pyrophosphohydrolase MazG putative catalytic core domain-containing protein n=1 Tax=Clostridium formicaceticum TaxID=1497 RepID=A0AAC9RJI7_9CLOT|nr:hypothetical protein [Clostridium formicaceticum]AOY76788.1 hypothetical protein BJL90_13555 [Clostridium formicaceticum]ARE87251.1 hypothetical protein CLFO_16500 [Clostridium formicaceticum]
MINIKMPVLKKDHEWNEHLKKLREESYELRTAVQMLDYSEKCKDKNTLKDEGAAAACVLSEVLDVMQVCIGIIEKLLEKYPTMLKNAVMIHIEKLYQRGWKFRKWIQIEEE